MARKAREQIRDLDEKLDAIMERLDAIEAVVAASQQTSEISAILSDLRYGISLYSEPLKAIKRLYDARRFLRIRSVERDEISRLIIQSLALRGELNISQIEREVRRARGRASRRTVRARLKGLEKENIVQRVDPKSNKYALVE